MISNLLSVLIPSRGRVPQLTKLLDCIPTCHEVLVAVDEDDTDTLAFAQSRPNVHWHVFHPLHNISEYYNRLAEKAKGTHFLILNDDCVLPSDWPSPLSLRQGYYGRTRPRGPGAAYAEFPVLTREGMNKLGWVMPPAFSGWGADYFVYRVYEKAGRVVDLPLTIIHERDVTGASFRRMQRISGHYNAKADVTEWAVKLI